MVEKSIQAKALERSSPYSTETLLDCIVPKISKAWTALAKVANLAALANLVPAYIFFDLEKKSFLVLSNSEQRFAQCEQFHHLLHRKGVVKEAYVDKGVWNRSKQLDAAHRLVT